MLLVRSVTLCLAFLCVEQLSAEHPIAFKVKWLTVDANEGCSVADFDGDGLLDVSAGRSWYRNGDWLPRPVRAFDDINGYAHSNAEFAYDVNQDGLPDIVAGGFFKTEVNWYENPGKDAALQGFLWKEHLFVDTGFSQNEASFMHDFNNDGKPEWISNSWVKTNPLIIWSMSEEEREVEVAQGKKTVKKNMTVPTLKRSLVHESGQGHGFGVGDINNDGHADILTGTGWHEGPAGDPLSDAWKYHADWTSHWSCPVIVRDMNKDGKNDIVWGNPHDYGLMIWFAEGVDDEGKLKFREQVIDKEFSQLHCIHFADLDGDGQDELITGKRVRAHNGRDPGGTEPPLVCYYKIDKAGKFTKHIIENGNVGIGLQIRTDDIDADGDVDIVVAGKEGTQILFSQLK